MEVADEHFDLSGLSCAARFAGTAQFEVDFSDFETVVGAAHLADRLLHHHLHPLRDVQLLDEQVLFVSKGEEIIEQQER